MINTLLTPALLLLSVHAWATGPVNPLPPAHATTIENFNSRQGIALPQIKSKLQNACWTFHHFDVNLNGWDPRLEGDGAMVADVSAIESSNSGIYTPLLAVGNQVSVSFNYTFSEDFGAGTDRWLNLYLTDQSGEVMQALENIDFEGINATGPKQYSTLFSNIVPGEFRLVLQYGGNGGTSRIAIDQLKVSAPLMYAGGCNVAPIALRDKLTGMDNRTASGTVLANDSDAGREALTAYLVEGSPHGTVTLNKDGSFRFAPGKDFAGDVTSFVYRVCDAGSAPLCSENTTAYLHFPSHAPVSELVQFSGAYRSNGQVELGWTSRHAAGIERFDIERSTDGNQWESAGSVHALKNDNATRNGYAYTDRVSRNTAQKKDIYYRLREVGTEGRITLSRLLVVRVYNTRTLSMISVTPNTPGKDIAVNVQLQENAFIAARVTDASGASMIRRTLDASQGLNYLSLDGSSRLRPGMYLLEVIVNSKERMTVKLLKE